MAGFLAGITAYSFLRFSASRRLRFAYLGVMVLLTAGLLISAYGFSLDPLARTTARDPEKMVTLTGRTPLWANCMEYVAERPGIGYGFEGFWTLDRRLDVVEGTGWWAAQAHSAYIDLLLALGIVGLALHTFTLLLVLRRAAVVHRVTREPEYAAAAALSAQYLVFGALETTMLIRFSSILFFTYCLFLMVAFAGTSQGAPALRRRGS